MTRSCLGNELSQSQNPHSKHAHPQHMLCLQPPLGRQTTHCPSVRTPSSHCPPHSTLLTLPGLSSTLSPGATSPTPDSKLCHCSCVSETNYATSLCLAQRAHGHTQARGTSRKNQDSSTTCCCHYYYWSHATTSYHRGVWWSVTFPPASESRLALLLVSDSF